MAEVRVGGAYIDWRARNAQFLSRPGQEQASFTGATAGASGLAATRRCDSMPWRGSLPLILAGAAAGFAVLVRQQAAFGSGLVEVSQRLGFLR